MFGRNKKKEVKTFDSVNLRPVIRCSICTGEQVAGFIDKRDGHFTEIMLLQNEDDKEAFLEMYGLKEVEKIY